MTLLRLKRLLNTDTTIFFIFTDFLQNGRRTRLKVFTPWRRDVDKIINFCLMINQINVHQFGSILYSNYVPNYFSIHTQTALLMFTHFDESDQFPSNFHEYYGFWSISIKTFQKNFTMLWNHAKLTKVATSPTEWPLGRARRISPSKMIYAIAMCCK